MLFDCPPSLGKVLFAVLIACDGVVAVTEPTIDSVHGVERLDETIRTVRKRANPRLNFDKIVLSRRRGTAEHNFRETELREVYGDLVARTIIPELATRQDAHSARTPIHQFRGGRAISLQTAYSIFLPNCLSPLEVHRDRTTSAGDPQDPPRRRTARTPHAHRAITPAPTPVPARSVTPSVTGSDTDPAEGLSATHNTRIRPSIKARLRRGVDKLRYETGDRTISEASITDKALQEYLDKHGL